MAYSEPGKTRKRVFAFVQNRILAGLPPTVREVQEAFHFRAVQSAREHLEALVEEGLLRKEPRKARGYRLSGSSSMPVFLVPLLGRIQAGTLTTAVENLEGYVSVQSRLPQKQLFALRVQGASMRDAGILSGDIVIVRRQANADSGNIVVALVDDEATVKTIRIKEGRIELHPANSSFQPIIPDPRDFSILGKVIEVRRYLESLLYSEMR